ncbi:MAG: hypothetical protein RIQ68_906 [Pseudomonadota bacterium]
MAFRLAPVREGLSLFRRAHQGAVAVEFALAAWPLLFALLFLADMAANAIVFDKIDATGRALAAQLRGGVIDPQAHSAQSFRDQFVCPGVPSLSCERVIVHLAPAVSMSTVSPADIAAARWCAGAAQDLMIFQIAYPTPFLSRIWAGDFADQALYYVASFGLRNAPNIIAGEC